MADSYYEYLLKAWGQGGQHKGELLLDTGKRWEMAMDDMITYLVRRSKNSTSLADVHGSLDMAFSTSLLTMNHLSCFVPGMLALGVYKGTALLSRKKQKQYLAIAEGLTETCYKMAQITPTGLAADNYSVFGDKVPLF